MKLTKIRSMETSAAEQYSSRVKVSHGIAVLSSTGISARFLRRAAAITAADAGNSRDASSGDDSDTPGIEDEPLKKHLASPAWQSHSNASRSRRRATVPEPRSPGVRRRRESRLMRMAAEHDAGRGLAASALYGGTHGSMPADVPLAVAARLLAAAPPGMKSGSPSPLKHTLHRSKPEPVADPEMLVHARKRSFPRKSGAYTRNDSDSEFLSETPLEASGSGFRRALAQNQDLWSSYLRRRRRKRNQGLG